MKIVYVVSNEDTIKRLSLQVHLVDDYMIELRVDLMTNRQMNRCIALCQQLEMMVLVTYRTKEEGGNGDSNQYNKIISTLLTKNINWIDIELRHLKAIDLQTTKDISVIVSAHTNNLQETYDAIERMSALPFTIKKKIVFKTESSSIFRHMYDILNIHPFIRYDHWMVWPEGYMNNSFRFFSVLSNWLYLTTETDFIGPMNYSEAKVYITQWSKNTTRYYALLGGCVEQSVGHITHNKFFERHNHSCIYLKFHVDEINAALIRILKNFGIVGLSVTTPLKSNWITSFVTTCFNTRKTEFYNTLKISEDNVEAYNTDVLSIYDYLKMLPKKAKRVIIFGYGGVGYPLTCFLSNRFDGELLVLTRRDITEVKRFSNVRYVTTLDPSEMENACFIQTTTIGYKNVYETDYPFDKSDVKRLSSVIEVVSSPVQTRLIQAALEYNIDFVTGRQLFDRQALYQLQYWGFNAQRFVKPLCKIPE